MTYIIAMLIFCLIKINERRVNPLLYYLMKNSTLKWDQVCKSKNMSINNLVYFWPHATKVNFALREKGLPPLEKAAYQFLMSNGNISNHKSRKCKEKEPIISVP